MIGFGQDVMATAQRRVISVGQGIFALRYLSSAADPDAPSVTVEPSRAEGLTLIGAPGCPDRVLSRPGMCLLIRAEQPTSLTLTVSGGPSASLDASLRLERVIATSAALAGPSTSERPQIDVVAHLARRGDVAFGLGEWIGGPRMPNRIEGLTLRWPDRPDDVDLVCSLVSRGRRPRRFARVPSGDFAGTRGESAPVVELDLALVGEGASRYRLSGEAQFLGAHVIAAEGAALRFAGPTGREPLVGLRLSVAVLDRPSALDGRAPPVPLAKPLTGRVRVFRGAGAPAA